MNAVIAAARHGWASNWSLRVGVIATLVFLLIGFVSVAWTPYPIELIDVGAAMQDPGGAHWLGTDHLGRDLV
jgi:peptide/nickel transport system permease protein